MWVTDHPAAPGTDGARAEARAGPRPRPRRPRRRPPAAKRRRTGGGACGGVDLTLRIRQLEERRAQLTARWQARQRKDVEEEIASLRRTRDARVGAATPPPKAAPPPPAAPPKVVGATQVRTVRNGKEVTVYLADNDECPHCRKQMVMIPGVALLSCDQCGRSKPYLDATSASTAYGEEVEFSNFSYKRSNHFQEWLNSFQAKETTEIPKEVFERVMEELYRQRISDLNKITRKKVREVLKDLKLRKYYEHVTQITCRLNGKRPPRMTPDQEEQCRLMFMAIQGPFEKNCPPDRKNFLSYSYCLYKFCELMAYDEFLPCFSLLKGRDKLFKQDMIFKRICEDLGWSWLPSI